MYKRQVADLSHQAADLGRQAADYVVPAFEDARERITPKVCLLYTSDAADERSSVDLGGRRIIKKKTQYIHIRVTTNNNTTERTEIK